VAGPIERATHLLPQVQKAREFNYEKAVDGLRQILWGLFQKMVIADSCAEYANRIFDNYQDQSGISLFLGAVLFAFQIYGDFSGYSCIALGTSRLFGIELLQNFSFPYFSRDIAEFWRRWHISLSSWFRDYLYIPLNGSKGNTFNKIRNTFIIFLVSGFWHGANWTFIMWGAINAFYFLPLLISKNNRKNMGVIEKLRLQEFFKICLTFFLTCIAWIFFRAESVDQAFDYLISMFSRLSFDYPAFIPTYLIALLIVFIIIEWLGRRGKYALENIKIISNAPLRWSIYYVLIACIFFLSGSKQEFIYFQF
jgi:D-alanyl-lipoteichoic acid acyltransferase DltB (MBOAT superfamily)